HGVNGHVASSSSIGDRYPSSECRRIRLSKTSAIRVRHQAGLGRTTAGCHREASTTNRLSICSLTDQPVLTAWTSNSGLNVLRGFVMADLLGSRLGSDLSARHLEGSLQ